MLGHAARLAGRTSEIAASAVGRSAPPRWRGAARCWAPTVLRPRPFGAGVSGPRPSVAGASPGALASSWRACASSSSAPARPEESSAEAEPLPEAPPKRHVIRLLAPCSLRSEADLEAEVLRELSQDELVEAIGDVEGPLGEWLLVRSSLEEEIKIMTDEPLTYQDGWLHQASFEICAHQLGDKVAARVIVKEHTMLDMMRMLPPWNGGEPLPKWAFASVAEVYTGRVQGVVQQGRLLVQRPSGAIPERVATLPENVMTPRRRFKETCLAGLLGFGMSAVLGVLLHIRVWLQGTSMTEGHMAFPQLIAWLTFSTIFLSPLAVVPCYLFTNTLASTTCAIAWLNMVLYGDVFSD